MERIDVGKVKDVTGIYLIWDALDEKGYVGQAVNIGRRWTFHLWELNAGRHENKEMQKAWDDHSGAFSFSVLEVCKVENLNEREIYWVGELGTFGSGYNRTPGGELAGKRSPETCQRMSYALKGRVSPMKGKHFSEDHRKKISEKLKGNHNSGYGADNHASKPVVCIDTGMRFSCAAEAGRYYGSKSKTPGVNIRKVCVGERSAALGHRWAFADNGG